MSCFTSGLVPAPIRDLVCEFPMLNDRGYRFTEEERDSFPCPPLALPLVMDVFAWFDTIAVTMNTHTHAHTEVNAPFSTYIHSILSVIKLNSLWQRKESFCVSASFGRWYTYVKKSWVAFLWPSCLGSWMVGYLTPTHSTAISSLFGTNHVHAYVLNHWYSTKIYDSIYRYQS